MKRFILIALLTLLPSLAQAEPHRAPLQVFTTRIVDSSGTKIASVPRDIAMQIARQAAINEAMRNRTATTAGQKVRSYNLRHYESQNYMPYHGHVSRPEPETTFSYE